MYVLGIKPSLGRDLFRFWGTHHGGACLLDGNDIVAAAEEERFTREKYGWETFPNQAIEYVLDEARITVADLDTIAIGREPRKRIEELKRDPRSLVPSSLKQGLHAFEDLKTAIAILKGIHVGQVEREIDALSTHAFEGRFESIAHHRSHAASAYYCADADRPLTITIDAMGEHDSTVIWDRTLERHKEFSLDNSIGFLYSKGTQYLGYRHGGDAGKVMGLAPYGEYREDFAETFDHLVDYGDGEYDVTRVLDPNDSVGLLEEHFGERRTHPEEFKQYHKDFAYHLQLKTEKIVTHLVEYYTDTLGCNAVALAGGVAMNCKLNREIRNLDCVDSLFVQPAANDTGICLGAALEGYRREIGMAPDVSFTDVYLGPSYSNAQIESELEKNRLDYDVSTTICARVADLLADGNLVGWFQGRMEFGARALGSRSILADPRNAESLDLVNKKVKNREPWRPFAPSLTYESRETYLENGEESPFMIVLDTVAADKRDEIPAVVHIDSTSRPQTVRPETNERYHTLLTKFEERTGTPVLLNTSFNVSGEPIVESPRQAIQDFYGTGLDALAVGDFLLTKSNI